MNFYLLGMPRCRSLWLSHLLSFGDSYCFHEILSQRDSLLANRIPNIYGYGNVGSADTYPLGFDENIVGESPLVLIDRPLRDIKTSLTNSFGFSQKLDQNHVLESMYDQLQSIVTPNYIRVDFDTLDDRKTILKIMEFCGVRADAHHVNKMMASKIVVSNNDIENSNHSLKQHMENIDG